MKIAFVADGRSPTTRAWIKQVASLGHTIHLISSYPSDKPEYVDQMDILPIAGGGASTTGGKPGTPQSLSNRLKQKFRLTLLGMRYYYGPLSVMNARRKYRSLIHSIQPDLVHALRIPYEGMLAAYTPSKYRVIMSTWGNDFTLHGQGSSWMRRLTRAAVHRADGFMADCFRDIWLAKQLGLRLGTPTQFAPGNGGLNLDHLERIAHEFRESSADIKWPFTVINPRGIRPAYVMNDSFFQAIPFVLQEAPEVRFLGAAMKGQIDAEKWVERLKLGDSVTLLEPESQLELWHHFLECQVLVSPAIHDGTPNSILEGMALGCLPVAGDIDSLREWIENGRNGILVDPRNPVSIAEGILEGIKNTSLRQQAALINQEILHERVDAKKVRVVIRDFYREIANR